MKLGEIWHLSTIGTIESTDPCPTWMALAFDVSGLHKGRWLLMPSPKNQEVYSDLRWRREVYMKSEKRWHLANECAHADR